jgi:hypothetical protein
MKGADDGVKTAPACGTEFPFQAIRVEFVLKAA